MSSLKNYSFILLFCFLSLFKSNPAFSYPGFISYGYTSCLTCHYNPMGNGPLTDYGRALSATVVSAKPFFLPEKVTEEELGEYSGFFGKPEILPEWLRFSADFRGLFLIHEIQNETTSRFIPMQTDGSFILQMNENTIYGVGTFGYIPISEALRRNATLEKASTLISREHYLAYRPKENMGFYLGMQDTVYGLRIPDHTAFSRTQTYLSQNDQTHGLMGHFLFSKFELGAHAILGNFFQKSNLRQKGGSLKIEHDTFESTRFGASILITESQFRSRNLYGIHSSTALSYGNSILFELGLIKDQLKNQTAKLGNYVFLQSSNTLSKGLNFITTLEYYKQDIENASVHLIRITPGIQYFPMQRIELRFEAQNTQSIGSSVLAPEKFIFLNQIHIWL